MQAFIERWVKARVAKARAWAGPGSMSRKAGQKGVREDEQGPIEAVVPTVAFMEPGDQKRDLPFSSALPCPS